MNFNYDIRSGNPSREPWKGQLTYEQWPVFLNSELAPGKQVSMVEGSLMRVTGAFEYAGLFGF
jgi:hypothetical protein